MKKIEPQWITGLVDGEGYFLAAYHKHPTCVHGEQLHISFGLSLRWDDIEPIKMLTEYFGVGSVAIDRGGKNPVLRYKVYAFQELLKIVEHFEKFPLQSKKSKDFDIWKEIVKKASKRNRGEDITETKLLCKKLREVRKCAEQTKEKLQEVFGVKMWSTGKQTWRTPRPIKLCTKTDCKDKHYAKGLCQKHYRHMLWMTKKR